MINNSNIIRRASVAAIAETTGGIGYKGQLPWEKLALDFAFLKWVTTGQFRINEDKCELERFETNEPPTVVFGNKTWISIGKRPLPKRNNVVITSRPEANTDKVRFISNLNELREELVYFLGGSGVYRVAMDQVQAIFLTKVSKIDGSDISCDVFFPIKELKEQFKREIDITAYAQKELGIKENYNRDLERFEEHGFYYKFFIYIADR